MRSLLAVALIALVLSGCAGQDVQNGPDGQSVAGEGSLAYNGASDGTQSDTVESDGSCSLHVSANLGSGSVKVTLRTTEGTTVEKTVSGPGQFGGTVGDASGAAGDWKLTAVRSGGFTGQYAAHAEC